MREQTRYRVTGSLFLLAVAVICLPMLLDGAGVPAQRLPELPLEDSLPEVKPLASRAPESDFVARVEQLREQVDEDGFLAGSGTRFGEPVLGPTGSDGQDGGAAEPAPAASPAPVNTQTAADAWAIQVASFSQGDNAEEFRARLRRDGYEAFISTARVDQAVLRRVAVGPMLDRERAESLRGELSARYDVQARVMTFSN